MTKHVVIPNPVARLWRTAVWDLLLSPPLSALSLTHHSSFIAGRTRLVYLTCDNGIITLPSSVVLGSSTSTRNVVTPA